MKYSYLLFISAVSFSSTSHALDLFVNKSGTGDSCTASDPCSSIQQAVNVAGSDAIIHIAAGT